MKNYLLEIEDLPKFSLIKIGQITEAVDYTLEKYSEVVKEIELIKNNPTWDNLVLALDYQEEKLSKIWSQVSHLNSVKDTPELRIEYEKNLKKISVFENELGHNKNIYQAFINLSDQQDYNDYSEEQKLIIKHAIRDFKLTGVNLPDKDKNLYKEYDQKLTDLSNKFSKNVLDSTGNWSYYVDVDKKQQLKGIPEHFIETAARNAKRAQKDGWLFTLNQPIYSAIISYADNQTIREVFYTAYNTKASEISDQNKWDNGPIIVEILDLRDKIAKLVGFKNYMEYSIETKMASSVLDIKNFLTNLLDKTKKIAKIEFKNLQEYAKNKLNLSEIKAFDTAYVANKLQQEKFKLSQEELRPYFPEDKVLQGAFSLVKNIFDMQITEIKDCDAWDPDVRLFKVVDNNDNLRGMFFVDLYSRNGKRSGAWMDECISRLKKYDGNIQYPVAHLVTNFSKPNNNGKSYLTHDEVITVFHELGHSLHHILTKVDYYSISGTKVDWDAVELPSQFLENYCWEWEIIKDLSSHIETGDCLPEELFTNLRDSKNYNSAMAMVRQIEFALIDLEIHTNQDNRSALDLLKEIRDICSVTPRIKNDRFLNSFSHIFDGGYAGGYYSYLWAEVLSSDAYAMFEENGILDRETGYSFLTNILEKGGSKEAMELYLDFRGKKPTIDALLKNNGIQS